MGTPQVFPLIWNGQGQTPDQAHKGIVWNPKAPFPGPLKAAHDKESDEILADQANAGKTPIETELDKVQAHNDVATNALCAKNRKRKQSSMELPFDPAIEEGSVYALQGFAQNFDGKWLITEVQYSFTGKGGSRLNLELMQCLDTPSKTPAGATSAAGGANGKKRISVPTKPSDPSALLHDGGINSLAPQPKNATGLTTDPNELAPTWLNANGALNKDQQDLSLGNVGPVG